MKIPWIDNRCILCLERGDLSEEHIIPAAIGGRLTAKLLCRGCNSQLGSTVEKVAKTDPSVRIALENLAFVIPEIYSEVIQNEPFLAKSGGGSVSGFFRNGDFRVLSFKNADGSLILPTSNARKSIETMLMRQGCTELQIAQAIRRFDDASSNEIFRIHEGIEASKWDIERLEIDFSGTSLMNPLVPLKIAFEFMACQLGSAIYSTEPQLQQIRQVLVTQQSDDQCFGVDRLNAQEYKPFHGIAFEGNNPYAQFQVRLFGWLGFLCSLQVIKS